MPLTAGEHSLITDKDIIALAKKCEKTTDYHYIDGIFSPLSPRGWLDLLYDDNTWDHDSLFILDGVFNGFRVIDPNAAIPVYDCKNYKSCFKDDNNQKMNLVLTNELLSGKISIPKEKPDQIHALGAVPKPNGSVRHITDCSRPLKSSVNNYMNDTFSSFSFNTIDDIVKDVSPSSYMATVDLQDAYRSVPINPTDRPHFGLRWDFGQGQTYLTDNFLCFGSRCSAFIFNRLTDAVSRYMRKKGYCCYNYLDDFIIVESTFASACDAQNFLIFTLRKLGFYISWKKLISPTQYCRFLGIDIDSVEQRLILPDDKQDKLHKELCFWENKRTATKIQLQRLCGILNFCCKVIRGGRVYMFHMIRLLKLFNTQSRISLPTSFHEDISWWKSFACIFNGCADFFDPETSYTEVYTDACLRGLSGICGNDYYQAKIMPCDDEDVCCYTINANAYAIFVPKEHAGNINVLELLAFLIALARWNYAIYNCRVIAYCDNLQVCYNLAKDKSRNPLSNNLLRSIFWICVMRNIYISPVYIPSSCNYNADYLSRAIGF